MSHAVLQISIPTNNTVNVSSHGIFIYEPNIPIDAPILTQASDVLSFAAGSSHNALAVYF